MFLFKVLPNKYTISAYLIIYLLHFLSLKLDLYL